MGGESSLGKFWGGYIGGGFGGQISGEAGVLICSYLWPGFREWLESVVDGRTGFLGGSVDDEKPPSGQNLVEYHVLQLLGYW